MDKDALEQLMLEDLGLQEQIRKLKQRRENIKANILVILKLDNIESWEDDDGNMLTFKTYKRRTFQKDKAKLWLSDEQFEECYLESEYETLRIVPKERRDKFKGGK